MSYAWVITKSNVEFGHVIDTGVIGPKGMPIEQVKELLVCKNDFEAYPGAKGKFRMLDCDGEVYYEGIIIGDYEGFEPLDDFGCPDSGCTDIQYWENGTWQTL